MSKTVTLIRQGDFYNAFGDDARAVSDALGTVLLTHGNGDRMATVPHHRLVEDVMELLAAGFNVTLQSPIKAPTPDIDTHSNWLSEAWRLIDRIDSPGSYSIAEGYLEGAPTGLDTEALWVELEGKRQELWKASGALQP